MKWKRKDHSWLDRVWGEGVVQYKDKETTPKQSFCRGIKVAKPGPEFIEGVGRKKIKKNYCDFDLHGKLEKCNFINIITLFINISHNY